MSHKLETIHQRKARRERSKGTNREWSREYTTANGIDRIKTLHPTKGFRDRNIDCAASVVRFPGLREGEHRLSFDATPIMPAKAFYRAA